VGVSNGAVSQIIGTKSQEIGSPIPLSTARSLLLAGLVMDDRIIDIPAALCVAAIVAVTVVLVAHYLFGASLQTSASIGAAVLAPLVAIGWFGKKPK
jgi:hypothetical protein